MKTITKLLLVFICCLFVGQVYGQEKETNKQQIDDRYKAANKQEIENLKGLKAKVGTKEKELLREAIEAINKKLDRGEVTQSEADKLKKEAAKKHALNIENRTTIINNRIALLKRNVWGYEDIDNEGERSVIRIGNSSVDTNEKLIFIGKEKNDKPEKVKYDRRTKNHFLIAFGLNNSIIDGESFDDTPYEIGGSRFFEIGYVWQTRIFKNTNFLRLNYGFSFQINGLKQRENLIFVQEGNETRLEEFEFNLRKSKLTNTNLVFPVHFEFGPSKKFKYNDRFRYSIHKQFRMGIGGYAGFNIATRQKLKFRNENGDRVKNKIKQNYNTTDLVYGLSSYIGFGTTSLYVKYDLSSIFKDQLVDQNNISLGVRFNFN